MSEAVPAIARETRKTVTAAGAAYVEHLEHVMQRKRTTIQDYRGYLRGHLGPHFDPRTLDRIEPGHVESYLRSKLDSGLSARASRTTSPSCMGCSPSRSSAAGRSRTRSR